MSERPEDTCRNEHYTKPSSSTADRDEEPEHLCCPITREMFRDPVTVSSGHTYERGAIFEHLRKDNLDPLTRENLSDSRLVASWTVRKCVEEWLRKNPNRAPEGLTGLTLPEPGFSFKLIDNDIAALRAIRERFSTPEIWPDTNMPGEWTGVVVEDHRVVELDLSHKGLTTLPGVIGTLTSLKTLCLEDNALTTLPESFGKLVSLKHVTFCRNKLGELPKSFSQLVSLEKVSFCSNKLVKLDESISRLTSLRLLNVNNNNLKCIPCFRDVSAFEELNLSNNQLKRFPPAIPSLHVLHVGNNQLTRLPAEMEMFKSLRYLDMSENRLRSLPDEIGNLGSLETLKLAGNELERFPDAICNLSSLMCLDLSFNPLTSISESVGMLPALKEMRV